MQKAQGARRLTGIHENATKQGIGKVRVESEGLLARFIEAEQELWWPVVKAAAGPK